MSDGCIVSSDFIHGTLPAIDMIGFSIPKHRHTLHTYLIQHRFQGLQCINDWLLFALGNFKVLCTDFALEIIGDCATQYKVMLGMRTISIAALLTYRMVASIAVPAQLLVTKDFGTNRFLILLTMINFNAIMQSIVASCMIVVIAFNA